jgi:signal peptidase I
MCQKKALLLDSVMMGIHFPSRNQITGGLLYPIGHERVKAQAYISYNSRGYKHRHCRNKYPKKLRGFELKRSHLLREIIETLALTLLIFLVIRFVLQSYHIEGTSMQPGLATGEYVFINKVAYTFRTPERGDVIVFHFPRDTTQDLIKRVIGIPGDTIKTDRVHVWVNNTQLNEPYISTPLNPSAQTWKVPPNDYFVLGDNRPASYDSRNWDFVPKDYIIGKAIMVFWPLQAVHFINTYQSVYSHIKDPS